MIKVIIAAFLLVLLIIFVRGLIKDRKMSQTISEASDRLQSIKNQHMVLDIEAQVQVSEQYLKYRKDAQ